MDFLGDRNKDYLDAKSCQMTPVMRLLLQVFCRAVPVLVFPIDFCSSFVLDPRGLI